MAEQEKKKPVSDENEKGEKLTEETLKNVTGSGEFDAVPTVDEHAITEEIRRRV